jgi:hypothetical protein
MLAISPDRKPRALEFGIYRDGDNNLDGIQSLVIDQAVTVSKQDSGIEFTVEDTGSAASADPSDPAATRSFRIADGKQSAEHVTRPPGLDMSSRANLARFVARTLDNAEKIGAKETWIDLVDHGAGDGGGLEADHSGEAPRTIMRLDDMAGAIADGVALHAARHPEDAARRVDGVVANECLMATLSFSSALSHAGVRYLAASPETMIAPGVPSSVALDIAAHEDDPAAMAHSVVDRTMDTRYFPNSDGGWTPAAAFDVLDLDPQKASAVESRVRDLNSVIVADACDRNVRAAVREDAKAIDGMVRFPAGKKLPWRADRPAIELYRTFAQDGRLPQDLRTAARGAADAIAATVLAHRETGDFAPFGGAGYGDAAGPTVHFPLTRAQIDPWAPAVSETDNAFYRAVGAADLVRAVA